MSRAVSKSINAASTGANTVNGPSLENAASSSASSTAATNTSKPFSTAVSTIVPAAI